MLASADESIHGLAVEIPTNHREIPGSTPGRYNLQIEITSFDPAGQQMLGQHILFKWPTYGKISACNTNPKRKVSKQIVNFIVFYPDDGSSGPHCLSLDNYNIDIDNDCPNHT